MVFKSQEKLCAALRNWADGDRHCEAAVELLIDHGHWPAMLDQAGLIESWSSVSETLARPLLATALGRLADPEEGVLYASSSETKVLWVAASLAAGVAINLSNALSGLDAGNQMRVARALCAAMGGVPTVDPRF